MFEITKADDISILHLYGELTLLEMEILEKTIRSFKKRHYYKILLDLTGVDHVHFEVTKKLADQAVELRTKNGDIKLAHANEKTRQVFQFTGADQYLEDYSSTSEAILSFLKGTAPEAVSELEVEMQMKEESAKGRPIRHNAFLN